LQIATGGPAAPREELSMSTPRPVRRPAARPRPAHAARLRAWLGLQWLESRVLLSVTNTILHNFAGRPTDAVVPTIGLTLLGNKLYGVSQSGGPFDDGTQTSIGGHKGGVLFSINTDGSGYQILHNFGGTLPAGAGATGADGYEPLANLTAFNGKLYGTTPFGGPLGGGIIFSINADGSAYTVVHVFGNADPIHQFDDGAIPNYGSLVPLNNKLYGIASAGGRPLVQGGGNGVLFSIDPNGNNYTKVHVFDFGPTTATYNLGLVTDGSVFYGATGAGGPSNDGTLYALNVDGSNFHLLHTFTAATEGFDPLYGLTLVNGTLLGVTPTGGPNSGGALFSLNTDGSNFTIRKAFTTHPIANDGYFPMGPLLKVGNRLYGTTTVGGPGFGLTMSPVGTVFSVALDGTDFQNLYTFNGLIVNNKKDGSNVYGALASDGTKLYGVTGNGGTAGVGTIFSVPLNGNGGSQTDKPRIEVSLNGDPITSNQAAAVNFGAVALGDFNLPTRVFTVTNTGGATLTLGTPQMPSSSFFVLEPLAASLAPGESDTFTVAMLALAAGTPKGAITIATNSGGTSTTFKLPVTGTVTAGLSDLSGVFADSIKIPAALVAGDKFTVPLTLSNTGAGAAKGTVKITLKASADAAWDDADPTLAVLASQSINIAASGTGKASVTVVVPANSALPAGDYQLLAKIEPVSGISENAAGNNVVSRKGTAAGPAVALHVASSDPDLTVDLGAVSKPLATYVPGDTLSLPVTVNNLGGGAAGATKNQPITVTLRASADDAYDAGDLLLGQLTLTAPIARGKSKSQTVKLTLPAGINPGALRLVATVSPGAGATDADTTNDTAASPTTLTFARQFGTIAGRPGATALSFTDADGTPVTLTLTGPGLGVLTPTDSGYTIAVTGTTTASSLQISTAKAKGGGDDGRFTLSGLTVGNPADNTDHTAINAVSAATTDLAGDVAITGPATSLTFGDVTGAALSVGAPASGPAPLLSVSLGRVTNAALTSAIGLKALSAIDWRDTDPGTTPDVVSAPFLATLTAAGRKAGKAGPAVAGDFQASLALTAATGATAAAPTLGSASVAGSVSAGTWTVAGAVDKVTLGGAAATSALKLAAVSLSALTVKGALDHAAITLSQAVDPDRLALGALTAGQITASEIRTAGNIGAVKAAVLDHTLLFAGVLDSVTALPTDAADFVSPTPAALPTIASLTLTGPAGSGTAPALIDAAIAAGTISKVSLPKRASAVADPDAAGFFGFATRTGPVASYAGPASTATFISGADAQVD
jgi:uncharacterized repeat protein (TIGR03803 family)